MTIVSGVGRGHRGCQEAGGSGVDGEGERGWTWDLVGMGGGP